MAKLSKKQKALADKVDATKLYAVDEAIGLAKSLASSKFDETLEVDVAATVSAMNGSRLVRNCSGIVAPPA